MRKIWIKVVTGLFLSTSLDAQTWNGLGGNDNWTNAQNWDGGAPVSSDTTFVQIAGSTRLTPVVDVPYTINRLDFATNAGANVFYPAFILSGEAITFSGASPQINGHRPQDRYSPLVHRPRSS